MLQDNDNNEMMSKMTPNPKLCHCALGGNLSLGGVSPVGVVSAALAEFEKEDLYLVAISRFFETPCFPKGAGPDYVNAVVSFHCNASADEILNRLHEIERRFLRKRDVRWGMRTLDLDLIAAENEIYPDRAGYDHWLNLPVEMQKKQSPEQLILPHPRIQDRGFVLVPLLDVAPDWRHPVLAKTVKQLHAALPYADLQEIKPI